MGFLATNKLYKTREKRKRNTYSATHIDTLTQLPDMQCGIMPCKVQFTREDGHGINRDEKGVRRKASVRMVGLKADRN